MILDSFWVFSADIECPDWYWYKELAAQVTRDVVTVDIIQPPSAT